PQPRRLRPRHRRPGNDRVRQQLSLVALDASRRDRCVRKRDGWGWCSRASGSQESLRMCGFFAAHTCTCSRRSSRVPCARDCSCATLPKEHLRLEVRREKKYGLELDETMSLVDAAGELDHRPSPNDELRSRIVSMRATGKTWKAIAT